MKRVMFLLLLAAGAVFAQSSYNEVGWFEFLQGGSSDWGDYDNDGDLDLLLTGANGLETKLYRNDGFYSFSYVDAGLVNVAMGDGKWGDFDNDGLLDILVTGETDPGNYAGTVRIYRNNGNETFTDVTGDLDYMLWSSADWGDFDNDGDLDFAVNGGDPVSIVKIYRNNSGTFELAHSMQGGSNGSVEWGDYDNDGDLDLIVTGCFDFMMNEYITKIYRNDGDLFTDIGAGLVGIDFGEAAWGDYDNDGDLDILLSGKMLDTDTWMDTPVTKIYRNDGSGIFTDINAPLMNLQNSSVAWGDCDLDGDLDAVVGGTDDVSSPNTIIYGNNGVDLFEDTFPHVLRGADNTDISLANIDGDWDLDVFVGGNGSTSFLYSCIPLTEQPRIPTTPENISVAISERIVNMDWTSLSGIDERSFNVHVEVNDNILVPSMSDSTGYRRTVSVGNAGMTTEYDMVLPEPLPLLPQQGSRRIEFKVQAVNNCYTGSGFSAADTLFTSNDLRVDSEPVMQPEDNLYWEYLIPDSIAYYKIEVSTDSAFSQVFQDSVLINSKKVVTNTKGVYFGAALNEFSIVDSLLHNQEYFWRVKPVYSNPFRPAHYTLPGDVLSFIFDPVEPPNQAPNPPASGFNPANGRLITDSTPVISWDYASDPDGYPGELKYTIELDYEISFTAPFYADSTEAGINYIEISQELDRSVEIYYRIRTADKDGLLSDWSGIQYFLVDILYSPDPPLSGFNPANDELTDLQPTINWGNAYDQDGHAEDLKYWIALGPSKIFDADSTEYHMTGQGITFYQPYSALLEGRRYYYRIKTFDINSLSSGWSATQQFITLMPPQSVKITSDGLNLTVDWDDIPINTKGIVYTVYGSDDPYSGFVPVAVQITQSEWTTPISGSKKFYRVTAGSSGKVKQK